MKRKDYRKPMMNVVELQHRTMLLQASAQMPDYNWHDEDEE